jgi:hypothetical protein
MFSFPKSMERRIITKIRMARNIILIIKIGFFLELRFFNYTFNKFYVNGFPQHGFPQQVFLNRFSYNTLKTNWYWPPLFAIISINYEMEKIR